MKQGFKACVCAVVLCAELFAAGALSAYAAQEQPLPDSGMTLDTAELTLDITEGDPAPVAYLNVQAPNDYFFLIWTSSDPAVASVDGTGKVLDTNVVYPVPEFKRVDQAKKTIKSMVLKNEVEVMAIGIFFTTSYILRSTVGVSCILPVEKFSDAPIFAFASAVTTTSPNCSELGYKVAFRTYVLPNSNLISVKTAFL